MRYTTNVQRIRRYEYTSSNQHGLRYKEIPVRRVKRVELRCKTTDAVDMRDLIVLGHELDVPVHFDFNTSEAYLELMSGEAVRKAT